MVKIVLLLFLCSVILNAQGFICAVGGGTENYNDWSDKPYGWIVEKADSGTIIVLSYSNQSEWIPDYFKSLGAESAYNKKIATRTVADLQSTYDEILAADGVFIKGGDQWEYVSNWKGTKTEDAIRELYLRGGVVSGTSAGAMVLSDVSFSARYGSVYPRKALKNPFINALALEHDFLSLYPNTIFDTHYIERGRFARLIPFFLKSFSEYDKSLCAVGIDDRTALCIDSLGIGTVYGSASISVFQADDLTSIDASEDYIIDNLRCDILVEDWQFDFRSREVIPSTDAFSFETSTSVEYPKTHLFLTGITDPARNISISFDAFFETHQTTKVCILYTEDYEQAAVYVKKQTTDRGREAFTIPINNATIMQQEYADTLSICDAIIFLGDNIDKFTLLNDFEAPLAQVLGVQIENSIPIYMMGNASKSAGEYLITNTDQNELAAYRGLMQEKFGLSIFPDIIIQPLTFDDSDYYENRSASVLWGIMKFRKRFGLYIDSNEYVTIDADTKQIQSHGSMPLICIDASNVTFADSSTWSPSGYNTTRQAVGMNNLRYTVSLGNKSYDLESHALVTNVKQKNTTKPNSFLLQNNFPNPFNGSTIITFSLKHNIDSGTITVYSLLGEIVHIFDLTGYDAGNYAVNFQAASNLPSGIYFYSLKTNSYFETKKMIYLK